MLAFKNISKSFKTVSNNNKIFDDFSMSVNAGEFLSIIGTNGAGKSTLVKLLVGDESLDKGKYY